MKHLFLVDERCETCPIGDGAVCSACNMPELERLERIKRYRHYQAGDVIARRADTMSFVGSIVEGVASLEKGLADGRNQVVGLLLPPDFLGRPGRSELDYDVRAVTDLKLCSFNRQHFESLLEEIPHLSQRLADMALDDLDAARSWMVLLGRKTAREKLATFLVWIVYRTYSAERDGAEIRCELPVARHEIADFLGLTLETVSRQIGHLKKSGIVSFEGSRSFVVADYRALLEMSGDDEDGGVIP